jgi:hypothetical protein
MEALTINEVSELTIEDSISGYSVKVSALFIVEKLFGLNEDAFWVDVMVLLTLVLLSLGVLWVSLLYRFVERK